MDDRGDQGASLASAVAAEITRRILLTRATALGAMAAIATRPLLTGAQASPVAGDDVTDLVRLSETLVGGRVDAARAGMLLQFLRDDPKLSEGLDQLIANPPMPDARVAEGSPAAVAIAILTFWYAGSLNGEPVADRDTAYYKLSAWQAMYTFPGSVCRGFGAWADEPASAPIVPGN
ncbi:MAG: hypothetical protein IT336_11695 [Thermomicrobiales bacterium]|nr:hypothetical protein [Thermomicrobiales bacterium]